MAEPTEPFASFPPVKTSCSGIDANKRRASRMMANAFPSEADSRPRQNRAGEQALYALTVRHFLDMSRVYLAFQYTGSRHWKPNGGMFAAPFSGTRRPAPIFSEGEKHVVG